MMLADVKKVVGDLVDGNKRLRQEIELLKDEKSHGPCVLSDGKILEEVEERQHHNYDRTTRGGGVLIVVKDTYSCTSINLALPIPECELVAASISFGKQKITLLSVYLPPGLTCNSYLQLFEHLELNLNFSNPVIIAGDFNIPEYVNSRDGNKSSYVFDNICHFISIANLSQQHAVLNHNLRLLDLILSNDHIPVKVSRHESALVSEDPHHPCLELDILVKGMEFRFVENPNSVSFSFRKANLEELYLLLVNTDWSKIEEFSDPDSACNYFYNTLHEKNYKCDNCDAVFNSEALLKIHSYLHDSDSSDEQTNHVCPNCQKKFPTQRQLVTHVATHAVVGAKTIQPETFKCPVCHKMFALRERLRVTEADILNSALEEYNGGRDGEQYCHLIAIAGNDGFEQTTDLNAPNSHLYRLLTTSNELPGLVPPR
ncbi:hypothetical protein Zmor_026128 [Zophobas morio]|uniref:C2H2-type domain-containing protein n=1 Tax=Zophobas morio TaxID=2755281 RepID=A0AA38M4T4_9CUCU|nr:hypothetical protein Zmor_026128 [Zophobas morio]